MKAGFEMSKMLNVFLASRPKFLTASAAPVLVGSALGFAAAGTFNVTLFILALLAMMVLNAGANMANDYFDHTSKNDWLNKNTTPFSGGSRYIQQGVLSPKTILLAALFLLTIGSMLGVIIVLVAQSLFILGIGIVGLLGGYFYTAAPVRLGYRGIGEFVIMLLFGILAVYGAYHLQTGTLDAAVLFPGAIVGVLIFLVILVNEFPDLEADAAVNKKTLVVLFGVPTAVWIYRIALAGSFVIAIAAMVFYRPMFLGGLFYLFVLPLAVVAMRFVNKEDLVKPGRTQHRASQITVLLHAVGSLALTAGLLISAMCNAAA